VDGASTFAVKIASVHGADLEWGASTTPRDSEPFRPPVQAQSSERHDLIKRLLSGTASGPSKQPQAIALPPDPQLRADLCAPTWKLGARGILLESKDGSSGFGNLRQRLGRSPGKGDAVVMAWSEGNQAAVSRHNAWKWERKERQRWIV